MQISENPRPIPADIREKLENYRTRLLSAGFLEPTRHHSADWHWYFYRPDTELTAFAVNLRGRDGYIEITYGLASTAFTQMAGDENALSLYGLSDTDITLRESFLVCDDSDSETLAAQIADFFPDTGARKRRPSWTWPGKNERPTSPSSPPPSSPWASKRRPPPGPAPGTPSS